MNTTEDRHEALTPNWSLLTNAERRCSGWLIGDAPPEPEMERPIRVLLSVLDFNLRQALALALRLDGHEVCESDDPVSPQRYLDDCHGNALADVVVCATSDPGIERRPRSLVVMDGRRGGPVLVMVRDPLDVTRLRQLVRSHREAT